jgi:hypothetical protein
MTASLDFALWPGLVYGKIASQAPQVPFWIGAKALLLSRRTMARNKVRE